MSTIKQISSLCKIYSVNEEIPEGFLDETDVDSYFYHNILDISQSHHRIVPIGRGSNKRLIALKVFHFCDSKLQQQFILKGEVSISKKEIYFLLDSLGEFLKNFDQANKVSQIPLSKPKFELGFTKAKDELFSHCYKDMVKRMNRHIRLSFRLEKNKTCVFSNKNFEQYGDHFILREVVKLGDRKIKHRYKNRFFLFTNVTFLRAITMCSAFSSDCGYNKSTTILIGNVYCPNTKCSGKLCMHKKTFQSLGKSEYQCPQCESVYQVRNIPFEDQTISFFCCGLVKDLHF